MNKLLNQILKFGVVGVLATILDYVLLIFLTDKLGFYYLISSLISYTISLIFNYFCSMTFVFERRNNIERRTEFLIFFVLSIIGLFINQMCMFIGVNYLKISYKIVKIMATFIVMVWNFITRKIFLEKGIKSDTK